MSRLLCWVLAFLFCTYAALFAAGGAELAERKPGEGASVIETRSLRAGPATWTTRIRFIHEESGEELIIDMPDSAGTTVLRLASGSYRYREDRRLRDGSPESDWGDNRNPSLSFEIREGEISLFPYVTYYFDTNRDHAQARQQPIPEEISHLPMMGRLTDGSIQTIFLGIDARIESEIAAKLAEMEGADQWIFRPTLAANNDAWPYRTASPVLAKRAEPEPEEHTPWEPPPLPGPGLKILTIGIDEYDDADLNLQAAGESARIVADALAAWGSRVAERVQILEAPEGKSTRSAVAAAVLDAAEATASSELLILYIAAHAVSDIKGRPFIVPSDGDLTSIQATCIPLRSITNTVSSTSGVVFIILDLGRNGPWTENREALFTLDRERLASMPVPTDKPLALLSTNTGVLTRFDDTDFAEALGDALESITLEDLRIERKWIAGLEEGYSHSIWFKSYGKQAAAGPEDVIREVESLLEKKKIAELVSLLKARAELFSDEYLQQIYGTLFDRYGVGDGLLMMSSPGDGEMNVSPDVTEIRISFSKSMHGRRNISWNGIRVDIDGSYWEEGDTVLVYPLEFKLSPNREYSFILNPELYGKTMRSKDGSFIDLNTVISFRTGPQ